MSLHILHISNDFGGTEVYKNLYQHLDTLGIRQTIFVPVNPRVKARVGKHDFVFKTEGSKIIYSFSQKKYHRFFYKSKIMGAYKDLINKVDLSTVNLIHTGTLCMTGAISYEIFKKYKIPYITSIRNTDINAYFKKMWWYKRYYYQILENASKIIFISPQYKYNCFELLFDSDVVVNIKNKTLVIPNGIDNFYFDNLIQDKKLLNNPIKVVYAGSFKKNKNLLTLIDAIEILYKKDINIELIAVGRSLPNRLEPNDYIEEIERKSKNKPYITLLEFMSKEKLSILYRDCDIFAMVSFNETFGLSYVEALSQKLPIIYTKGQGFDGFYDNKFVGYSAKPNEALDIVEGIEYIINNYELIISNINTLELKKDFNWQEIANLYNKLYLEILEN